MCIHTHTHTHTHSCRCVQWRPIYFLSPKWGRVCRVYYTRGRVCRVYYTRKLVINPLTGDQIVHNTHNTWFNPLFGDASYPLYTKFVFNRPYGLIFLNMHWIYIKHVQNLMRNWLAWLYGPGMSPLVGGPLLVGYKHTHTHTRITESNSELFWYSLFQFVSGQPNPVQFVLGGYIHRHLLLFFTTKSKWKYK